MMKRLIVSMSVVLLLLGATAFARTALDYEPNRGQSSYSSAAAPAVMIGVHRVGKIALSVTNTGTFGDNYDGGGIDMISGGGTVACEYPKNSGIEYLFGGAFWIGAVSGRDTLVSSGADGWSTNGAELRPDVDPLGRMIHRSLIDPASEKFIGAISEDDLIAVYRDTSTVGPDADQFRGPHRPLFLKVEENSYAWSYSYAEDFVLFDYKITNEGFNRLEEVYMGIYVDADVGEDASCGQEFCFQDDICGFKNAIPETTRSGCEYLDTVNIAWIADNDGDPGNNGDYDNTSATGITATRIVRTPSDQLEVSFNWWIGNGNSNLDFGPREKSGQGRWEEPFRDFRTGGLGTPEGDVNKYYTLRNQEFDYDQILTANILPNDPQWLYPIQQQNLAADFSDGYDTRYLLSFGPFTIDPGETLPLSFAYVAGENFHVDKKNAEKYLDYSTSTYKPVDYYANLNFEDLTTNARWASWIYDNPGVDTDDDGYFGKFIKCCPIILIDTIVVTITDTTFDTLFATCDTTYLTGDNVPDFEGAKPPPAPKIWVSSSIRELKIRFNGFRSETTPDEFLRVNNESPFDFEGYRVYYAHDERETSFRLYSSYDREDFNRYTWDSDDELFELRDTPFTRDQLDAMYSDTSIGFVFNPHDYPAHNPFVVDTFLYYFSPQDYNTSEFGATTEINKTYPGAPKPPLGVDLDTLSEDYLTEDGYLKYYEYNVTISELLPTIPYVVNVTAFDYGSPASGLPSLESSKTVGFQFAYASSSTDDIDAESLEIYVVPNPYRFDDNYRATSHDDIGGYEGTIGIEKGSATDRTRAINFVNVPERCMIRIYSLDGDLIREMDYPAVGLRGDEFAWSDQAGNIATWNLITRNTQLVVSGLYYWTVEDKDTGEIQTGKLVIIM